MHEAQHSSEPTGAELEALARLVKIGHGMSGQCVRVRAFLLAWWNAHENGGFDLWDACNVDTEIATDMATVFVMIARIRSYPDGNPRLPDLRIDMEAFIARSNRDAKLAMAIREACERFECDANYAEISTLLFHLEAPEDEKAAMALERADGQTEDEQTAAAVAFARAFPGAPGAGKFARIVNRYMREKKGGK